MAAAAAFSAVLTTEHALDGVSAASGLEISGGRCWAAGDDSVFLYELDLGLDGVPDSTAIAPRVVKKLRLCASRDVDAASGAVRSEEGIPKKLKPDFEAIAALPFEGETHIAVFGSASKAGLRDAIVLLNPDTGASRAFDGAALFSALRAEPRVTGTAKLNLEAAAVVGGGSHLALFQRGNIPGGHNAVALYALADFEAFLRGQGSGDAAADGAAGVVVTRPPLRYAVVHLLLPPIAERGGGGNAYLAGVSGASTVTVPLPRRDGRASASADAGHAAAAAAAPEGGDGVDADEDGAGEEFLLLSASYEATLNEIDDGPVLGSRVALLPSSRLLALTDNGDVTDDVIDGAAPVPSVDLSDLSALILPPGRGDGGNPEPVLAKVEGIAAVACSCSRGAAGEGVVRVAALAVTDPDGEASAVLQVAVAAPAGLLRGALAAA